MARYDPLLPSFQTLLPSLSLANSLANRRNCECQPQYDPKVNQDVIIHSDRCNERHAQPGRAAGYIEFRRSSQQFSPREELSNSPLGDSRLSPIPNNTIEQGRSPLTSASTIASRSPRSAHEGARQAFIKVEDDEDEAVSGANLPHGRSAQLHYSPNNPSQRSHGSSSQYERPQASFQSSYQRSDHAEYSHRPAPRLAFNTPLDPNHSRPLVPSRSPSPQSATTGVRCDCANCIPSSQSPTPNPDTQDQEHGSMGWRDGDEPLGREDIDMERKTGRLRSSNYGSELRWDERERTLYQDPRYQTASGPGGLSLTGGPYMPETQRMRPWVDSRHEYRQDHMMSHHSLYQHPHYGPSASAPGPSSITWSLPTTNHHPPRNSVGSKGIEKAVKHKSRKTWTEVEWKKLVDLAERSKRGNPENDIDWDFVTLGFGGRRCRQGILTVAAKRGLKVSTREARTIGKRALSAEDSEMA